MNQNDLAEYQKAIITALSRNPEIKNYLGSNSIDSIVNAYSTGNWSGVTSLSGKPFTNKQRQEAVRDAETALNPAFEAQKAFDEAGVRDTLTEEQQSFSDFLKSEERDFGEMKNNQDQNAADQGVLFTGSRAQKLRDLRTTFQDREETQRRNTGSNIAKTARGYQYQYGNENAGNLSNLYNLPGARNFDANVAGGLVTPKAGLSSVYNTNQFKFQGTIPVSQKASVQTRASNLLANRANKLTSTGYKNKF